MAQLRNLESIKCRHFISDDSVSFVQLKNFCKTNKMVKILIFSRFYFNISRLQFLIIPKVFLIITFQLYTGEIWWEGAFTFHTIFGTTLEIVAPLESKFSKFTCFFLAGACTRFNAVIFHS